MDLPDIAGDPCTAVVVRAFEPDLDQGMIYATWRNSSYYAALLPHTLENTQYFKEMTKKIALILKHAEVRIACLEDCPLVIIGYCVFTGTHLEWIYVKPEWRKQGIGTLLFPPSIQTVPAQVTKIGSVILNKKKLEIKNDSKSRD